MQDCYLPIPTDRALPLTKQFIEFNISARDDESLDVVYARYKKWMAMHRYEPLPLPPFVKLFTQLRPTARLIGKTKRRIEWQGRMRTDS